MSTEEKNNFEENKNSEPVKKKNNLKEKFVAFFKNNKVAIIFIILLLGILVLFSIMMRIKNEKFKNDKTQLITQYESKIDSLNVNHLKFATEVFSWSVRSELLRENQENLNQLLSTFVKQSGADIAQLINPKDKIILLSSDKKFEGDSTNVSDYENLTNTIVLYKDNSTKIISPVMGFNDKIGILVVELKKEKINENNTNLKKD